MRCFQLFFSLSIIISAFSFSACKREPPVNSLDDVFANIGSKPEAFKIDASIDNVVTGKKGTAVFIPADAFQFKDGTAPSGKVEVQLKEFYSTGEMIAGNLQTTNFDWILTTSGIIHLIATSDSRQLQLKHDKATIVCFPKEGSATTNGLFYGERDKAGAMNWQPGELTPLPKNRIGDDFFDDKIKSDTLFHDSLTWLSSYDIGLAGNFWFFNDSSGTNFFYHVAHDFKPSEELMEYFREAHQYITMHLCFDSLSGKIIRVKFDKDNATHEFDGEIETYFKNLPGITFGEGGVYYEPEYFVALSIEWRFSHKKYQEYFRNKLVPYCESLAPKLKVNELEYAIYPVTKTGWLSNSTFREDEKRVQRIGFRTKFNHETSVMLSFIGSKTILHPFKMRDAYQFEWMPEGMKANVIAISYANSKPLLSITAIEIEKGKLFEIMPFKEFSLSKLEAELNKLN